MRRKPDRRLWSETLETASRQITCERCGANFGCNLDGPCWCGAEAVRLLLPKARESPFSDCLCRACLREVAEEARRLADSAGVPRPGR